MPVITVDNLANPILLSNQKLIDDLKERAERVIISSDYVQEANWLVRNFGQAMLKIPKFEENYPTIFKQYQELINKCSFTALPVLPEDEILFLIENHFTTVFEIIKIYEFYDLWEKVEAKLVGMLRYEDRDAFKRKLRDALLKNNELITEKNIVVNEKEVEPTIANWLKDYNSSLGVGPVEKLKQAQYLSSSKNIQKVANGEKKKLIYLFNFYERLKLSSYSPEGIEEVVIARINDKPTIFRKGRLEEIDIETIRLLDKFIKAGMVPGVKTMADIDEPSFVEALGKTEQLEKKSIEKKDLAKQIQAELTLKLRLKPNEKKLLDDQINLISQSTKNEYQKLRDLCFDEIIPAKSSYVPDKFRALAILYILSQKGVLDELLKEEKIQNLLFTYFRTNKKENLINGFKVFPEAPEYLSQLLQYILGEKLHLSEEESAMYGLTLVKLMKKAGKESYLQIVYYDLPKKALVWKE